MKIYLKSSKTLLFLFFLIILNPISGKSQSNSKNLQDFISAPDLRFGRLPNGLIYYIKSIEGNQPKLDLRLLVKVGENMDGPDQLEFAHMIEHLAFDGSKNFPSGIHGDERFFEKFGMNIYDVRAYIGMPFTQYIFNAPAEKPEALDAALLWFKDIATGLNLSVADIQNEKGVVRQEFILRTGGNALIDNYARSELLSQLFPCVKDYSNFLNQKQTFTAVEMKNFYKTWYRPDLMAVSIVGNIDDLEKMENKIKNKFSDIPLPTAPAIDLQCDSLYLEREPQFVIVEKKSDSLNTLPDETVNFHLFYRKRLIDNIDTLGGLKRTAAVSLLNKILYHRFQEIENTYIAPYKLNARFNDLSLPALFMELTISAKNSSEKIALKKSVEILNQIYSLGVLKEEWDLVKNIFLKNLKNRDTETANYWVRKIRDNYVFGEMINPKEKIIIKKWLSELSLADFNELIKNFITPMPEDIGVIAAKGSKALSYTEEEIRALIRNSFNKEMQTYKYPDTPINIMTNEEIRKLKIKPYVIHGIGETGALELELANGVKLILKSYTPSPGFYDNEIMIHGFRNKGASILKKEKQASALNAPRFIRHSGVGDMNIFELKRFLSNTSLRGGVYPYINYKETGIKGNAKLKDFEKMLQLVYLYFTKPRKDKIAFQDWKEFERENFLNPSYGLNTVDFNNSIRLVLGDSMVTPKASRRFETISATDFETGFEIYQKFFGKAKDFTFIINGRFPLEPVLTLVRKYLGNLPNKEGIVLQDNVYSDKRNFNDSIIKIPNSKYYPTNNLRYGVRYFKKTQDKNAWQEQILIEALGLVTHYFSGSLRFKKGFSIYDWSVSGKFNPDLMQYEISFSLNCSNEEFDQIRKEFKKIISQIKSGYIPEKHLKQALQRMYHLYSSEGNGNGQLRINSELYKHYRYNIPWVDLEKKVNFVKSINIEDIVKTAKKYFKDKYLHEFVRGEIK